MESRGWPRFVRRSGFPRASGEPPRVDRKAIRPARQTVPAETQPRPDRSSEQTLNCFRAQTVHGVYGAYLADASNQWQRCSRVGAEMRVRPARYSATQVAERVSRKPPEANRGCPLRRG